MADSFTDAAFLTASYNRGLVLDELCNRTLNRQELQRSTGVRRVTLGRILQDLESRGWIERSNGTFEATSLGKSVNDAFHDFLDAIDTARRFQEIACWLPDGLLELGIDRFHDAEVAIPTPSDPQAPMRLAVRQVREAETVRILTHAFAPGVIDALHERGLTGEQTVDAVIVGEVLDIFAADPELGPKVHELLSTDGARFYCPTEPVPHILAIVDDRVGIGVDDEQGRPHAVLDVGDEIVHEWAVDLYERYRLGSKPVSADMFTA